MVQPIPQPMEQVVEAPEALSVLEATVILLGSALIGVAIHMVIFWLARRVAQRTTAVWDEKVIQSLKAPARLVFPLMAVQFTLPKLVLEAGVLSFVQHALSLGLIAGMTWAFIRVISVGAELVLGRHEIAVADNLTARRIHTQVRVLSRVVAITVSVVGVGIALMTFPAVREVGTSLLASAGLAGLAIGIAARPLLTNLIAGIQLAFTEPIRIDDVVIVEGEWGRIEELTSTYVVVRIWDERRLVVPLGHFLEKPFQNWTRTTSQILGTVFLYVDYRAPVDRIREELARVVKDAPEWDGRVQVVQVTETTAETMQIRLLVSAADAGKAFALRCRIRERMVDFLQKEYPQSLPRTRVEWKGPPEPLKLDITRDTAPAGASRHNGADKD